MRKTTIARRPMDFEGREQQMLVSWLEIQHRAAYAVTWHTPNGGARDKATAGKLKAQGVKAGVPDLQLAQARGGFFGLFIEFKATPPYDAAVSGVQKDMLGRLKAEGYRAVVCRGIEDAMREINAYLAMEPTPRQVPAQ